jgi:hypothetical protein
MATESELSRDLQAHPVADRFTPYHEISEASDALTVYFKPDADYSKRLTDHVTLFLSLESGEIVGCRIKGIGDILADLPNFIHAKDSGVELSAIFWSFRGGANQEDVRKAFNDLARAAGRMKLETAGR